MPDIEISFDLSRIDFRRTSDLIMESYWGGNRTDAKNQRGFDNSLCAAAYIDGVQVAFARVVTDYAVFVYLCDVIVWPEHRGQGIGQKLIQALLDHPDLADVAHWCLATADAHELYKKFGFEPSTNGRYMRLQRVGTAP